MGLRPSYGRHSPPLTFQKTSVFGRQAEKGKQERKRGNGKRMVKELCLYSWGSAPNPEASPRKQEWTQKRWLRGMGASVRNDVSNQGTKQSSIITSTGILLILKIKVTVINFKVKATLSTLRSLKFVTGLLNVFESK